MRTVKMEVSLNIGVGTGHKGVLDVDLEDDWTEAEIEEHCEQEWIEWLFNYIDGHHKIIE